MSENKKKKKSFISILFWLYTIFVLIWTFFGKDMDFLSSLFIKRTSSPRSYLKTCMSNCRVMMGGIEMYNMDHKDSYKSEYVPLDPTGTILEGYYKPISKPENKCFYWYREKDSEVYCICHGCPSNQNDKFDLGVKYEPTDKLKESYKQYLKEVRTKYWQDYIKGLPSRFLCGLLMPFYLIFYFVLFIISLVR